MHQYDQFKQDMEKLHKADLQNPIMANRSEEETVQICVLPQLRGRYAEDGGAGWLNYQRT